MYMLIRTNKTLIADCQKHIDHAKRRIKALDPNDWLDAVEIKVCKKSIRDYKKLVKKYELQIKEAELREAELRSGE